MEKYKDCLNKAWVQFENKNYVEAQEICKANIKSYPDEIESYYILGIIMYDENLFQDAVDNFNKVLEKDTHNKISGLTHYWLGEVYGKKNYFLDNFMMYNNLIYDYNLSIYNYEKSFEYDDYPRETVQKLIYIFKDDYYKKSYILKKSLIKFHDDPELIINYSKTLHLTNQIEESYNILLEKLNALGYSSLSYQLSNIYYNDSDNHNALLYCEKAQSIYTEKHSYTIDGLNYTVGKIHFKNKNWIMAHKHFKKCFDSAIDNNCNSDYKDQNLWVYAFGMIAALGSLKKNQDIKVFINTLPILDINLDYLEFEIIFHMDGVFTESEIDLYVKKNFSILSQIKNKSKDLEFNTKILWLQYILVLWEQRDDEQHQILREILHNDNCNLKILYIKLSQSYLFQIEKDISNFSILIDDLEKNSDFQENFEASSLEEIITVLFKNKLYSQVIKLKQHFTITKLEESCSLFEIAYAYNEIDNKYEAKNMYEHYLTKYTSGAALNNLANIYRDTGDIKLLEKAIKMYEKAIKLEKGDNALYERNLKKTKEKFEELEKINNHNEFIEDSFKKAIVLIKHEDYFSLETLNNFLTNLKSESDFKDGEMAIQNDYFPTLMKTNLANSKKLKETWISKNYIRITGKHDKYKFPIYKINPYIETELIKQRQLILQKDIPIKWSEGFSKFNILRLEEINYFSLKDKISKFNKKYKSIIIRDFDELVFNFLIGNIKATVVLSGSFVELILTFYLERKKIRNISYVNNSGRTITKNIYDSNLFDLITFIEQNNYFEKDFFHLTNLSRVYRNFIHPGLELKDELNKGKSDICFISTLEILKKI